MADQESKKPFVPRELKVRCLVRGIHKPEMGHVGGTFARERAHQTEDDGNSTTLYYNLENPGYSDRPLVAQRLRSVRQCSGGMIPAANASIGAPMCTFLYGGIKPLEPHDQLSLIMGPPKEVLDVFGNGYDPQFVRDADLGGRQGGDPADSEPFVKPKFSFLGSQNPTIPSVKQAPFVGSADARPTFNVWKANYSEDVESLIENIGFLGGVFKSTADPEKVRKVAVVRQNVTADGKCQVTVNASPNKSVTLRRLYPISYDLSYVTYPGPEGDAAVWGRPARLFYPYDEFTQAIGQLTTYRDILARGGDNCGFQIHFSVAQPSELRHPTSGELNASIEIDFGVEDPSPPSNGDVPNKIERFKIKLIPNQKPQVAFWHPALQQFKEIKVQGPIFCPNGKGGSFSVYVHFAGPAMLIGFDPEVGQWNTILPIKADKEVDDFGKRYQPWIPARSQIALTFKGLHATFEYGPMAFNNYNAENVAQGDPSSDMSHVTAKFKVPVSKAPTISREAINDYLNSNKFRHRGLDDVPTSVSYYGDWRRINVQAPELFYIGEVEESDLRDGKFATSDGRVIFDTTIEGPIFFKVRNMASLSEEKPRLLKQMKPWSDLTKYLSGFTVQFELSGTTNRSYMEGRGNVRLEFPKNDRRGAFIGAALKENQWALTLMAGYDELETYFKGVVQSYDVQYGLDGSSVVTLSLKDVGNELLDGFKFPQNFYFAGVPYKRLVGDVFAIGGLQDHIEIQNSPVDPSVTPEEFEPFEEAIGQSMGEAEIENGSNREALYGSLDKSLSQVLRPTMELVRRIDGFGCLHFEPNEEVWRLIWRQDPAFTDELIAAGEPDENGRFVNLEDGNESSIHGVLSGSWTESTPVSQLHPRYLVKSVDFIGEAIFAMGFNPQGYSLEALEELDSALEEGRQFDELGYVGYPKTYVDTTLDGNLLLQSDLNKAAKLLEDILFRVNHSISLSVYVTKPLKPFGRFRILTLGDDGGQGTERYFYKSVSYEYKKSNNYITARIDGERFSLSSFRD
jgi:hypothetical protein